MNLGEVQLLLSAALDTTRAGPLPGSLLGRAAESELGMARAYLSDGKTFASSGDVVNTLASFYYAFGWLHFGGAYGTLITGMKTPPCPFIAPLECLPAHARSRLVEKTGRYDRLLATAFTSVVPSPDPAVPAHAFASRVIGIAEVHSVRGRWLLDQGRYEDALATFSYGHGWIDAGVSAGLFRITAERDLFTV